MRKMSKKFCRSLILLSTILATLTGTTYLWGETEMPKVLKEKHKE